MASPSEPASPSNGSMWGGAEYAVFSWLVAPAEPPAELTEAEGDILARIVAGESNATIAAARGRSIRTVANQVAGLLRKLGADSRFDLIYRQAR